MSDALATKDRRNFSKLIKEARIGDPVAQYEVSLMYANGLGVERDIDQAMHWVKTAAEKNHAAAQYLLASTYLGGFGIAHNYPKALFWLLRAVEQGSGKAAFKLARLLSTAQDAMAFDFGLDAAHKGLPEAQHMVGERLVRTAEGVSEVLSQARSWYMQAADQGMASAQFALGKMYAEGLGGDVDLEAAIRQFRQASRQGLPAAQLALEKLDGLRSGRRDTAKGRQKKLASQERRGAEERWSKVAQRGEAEDQFNLGQMYAAGLGVEKSEESARAWYELAAQRGHAGAQWALGQLIEPDAPAVALGWYLRAAEQGNPGAQMAAARLLAQSKETALASLHWATQAAHQGHAPAMLALAQAFQAGVPEATLACIVGAAKEGVAQAQFELGEWYAHGDGVVQDPMLAGQWFEKAARQGHVEAQCALAGCYATGVGMPKNLQQACHWYERAADAGDVRAQWRLGSLLATGGVGVERDAKLATAWCKLAAKAGFAPAQATLGTLFARAGKHERAVEWWQQAAEQDDPEAMFNLAQSCLAGRGIPPDAERAFLLLVRAADAALPEAQAALGLMYAQGTGVAMDQIEACKWFVLAAAQGHKAAGANRDRARSLLSPAQYSEASRRASHASRV